ncbi:MAG: IS1634 family transposase [Anaerostipes sp.]|jgi:transposase
MRLNIVKSKNAKSYYIIRSIRRDGKNTSEIVEKLGTEKHIQQTYNVNDAELWARNRLDELNAAEKGTRDVKRLIPFSTDVFIEKEIQFTYNAGYLFLQQIYHQLRIPSICKHVKKNHSFSYDLNSILSRLVYGRILYPSSKLSCLEQSKKLIEQPNFELQHIYRALSVLSDDSDYIQSQLYKNSKKIIPRKTGILYYDCTNYFFEVEQESGLKQYGVSKEPRPNPIVQMGLFMDKSGIPLAFCIHKGNQNEQLSLKPLEQKIMKDFELSKFVVCTDAELSPSANRKFNNYGERSFITTQSIKKLNHDLKQWALEPKGWQTEGSKKVYDISTLEDTSENRKKIFYKQQRIEGWDEKRDIAFDQTLIVTYSLKYKIYQKTLREHQVERAKKALDHPASIDRKKPTDSKRFIKSNSVTSDGEVAKNKIYDLDMDTIKNEEMYDGFYAVCTNLDNEPYDIAKINHDRWEIEESFRIMKSEFSARPVYLQRDNRIEAHFLTCFIALLIYRILEKKLDEKYTCEEMIDTLKNMNMTKLNEAGYIPAYTRTELTDALHKNAKFHTDYELITPKAMSGICRRTKGL